MTLPAPTMKLTGVRCQCAACGAYFSRLSVFDKHRIGEYGKGRCCMTEDEMLAKGLRLIDGVWHGKAGARPAHWAKDSA